MFRLVITGSELDDFVRLNSLHIKAVRDNPGTGFELFQLRNQPHIQTWKQVESDYVRLAQVKCEDVLLLNFNQVSDLILFYIFHRLFNPFGVQVITYSPAAIPLGRRYYDSAVPTAQVIQQIVFLDFH